ncbi:GGDEF domain-containing protein [Marinilactibacillus sp. Marseille-P9653]|uniref:GGDEF domain-containing protein n=1 Tax=Marinilactibacillus sp. Marseille-P9653 TaxID=2866583 RepID=UPI001CE3B78A|nr:GGDEF domain-containing protein [Marinilactibacillus sp. Marseille-P9653]
MLSEKKQIFTWIIWFILYPTLFIITFNLNNSNEFSDSTFYGYLLLGIIISLFPLNIKGTTIIMINAVGIAMFLTFGIFAEMLLVSSALIIVLAKLGLNKQNVFKIPLNLLLFQIVSVSSGIVYYTIDPVLPSIFNLRFNVLSLTTYLVFYILLNRILIYFLDKYWYCKENIMIIDSELKFSLLSIFYVIPIAIMLVYLEELYSNVGIFIAFLPLITLTIILKFYFNIKAKNKHLSEINNLALELTGKYSQKEILSNYIKSWAVIFTAQKISYFEASENMKITKVYDYEVDSKEIHQVNSEYLICPDIIKASWLTNRMMVFNSSDEWAMDFPLSYKPESILVLPVTRAERIVGFLMMVDSKRDAYKDIDVVSSIRVLHSYLNIALENAFNFEKLQFNSRTDHLTGLTNLRAFENELKQFTTINTERRFSIIIIDLDHFKRVNDTYGHQAGNELLKQVSILLSTFVYEDERLARYGGEEFIFFIPDKTADETRILAEKIREKIEETNFNTHNYLSKRELITVNITASIGLATYPDQCSKVKDLVTLADRAMYVGSKQRGRNRVASIFGGEQDESEKELELETVL